MENGKRWFAFYVRSRAEQKVAGRLQEAGHEYYLPLVKTLRIWSDRKKWIWEPLIKSYVFICIPHSQIHQVMQTEGVVRVVKFSGEPVVIPDKQIENLRRVINAGAEVDVTTETFAHGAMVEIKRGALKGVCGVLVELKGKYRMVMQIDHFEYSILVTVSTNNIEKLDNELF